MLENQDFKLDQQKINFQVLTCELTVCRDDIILHTLTGISVIPKGFRIEPLDVKENMVRKSDDKAYIQKQLFEGIYFVNIIDYTLGEISTAANFLCEKWAESIWKHFISANEEYFTLSLNNDILKTKLVELNPEMFSDENDVDTFCAKHNLKIESFIQIAKFSQLEMELEGVAARLASEIVFFRKKLFTEVFLQKLDSKIYNYEKNSLISIPEKSKALYAEWKCKLLREIALVQKYIKSPFIFDDIEQYSNFKHINDFSIKNHSQQDSISETFYWIENFPKVKKRFEIAVKHYQAKEDFRDSIDNLRLTLELLVKEILQNEKSLDNQLSEISEYQKKIGIGSEIRNTFQKTLDYFNKFQNNKVKHADDVDNIHEVEFIFGLTMLFIRMLVKPNDKPRLEK